MTESLEMLQALRPDQPSLLTPCTRRGCRAGYRESEPGSWESCPRCHGSGVDPGTPAHSRTQTSVEAAASITPLTGALRSRVLDEIRTNGPLTDAQIARNTELDPNTARPRRIELVEMGLVEAQGTTTTDSGRRATTWGATDRDPRGVA